MAELILTIIATGGLLGVAALMFAENLFPPIPSEVILPLAGYAAAPVPPAPGAGGGGGGRCAGGGGGGLALGWGGGGSARGRF